MLTSTSGKKVEELNEKATPSEMLGFNLDTSNIETELANCRAVYEKYYSELFTGAQDPRELVKTIDAELETAGCRTSHVLWNPYLPGSEAEVLCPGACIRSKYH